MSDWISVLKQMPNVDQWVLLFCFDNDTYSDCARIFVGSRGHYGREDLYKSAHGDGYISSSVEITHWMPLPMPPEDK